MKRLFGKRSKKASSISCESVAGKRVLIVDDSATQAHVLRKILERAGVEVSIASSGEEGVAEADRLHPDLVLMDVVMPGMNGFQATRKLRRGKSTSDIPVIMVTTKDQETDREWGLRQGARDYLVKPVDASLLLEKVANVFDE